MQRSDGIMRNRKGIELTFNAVIIITLLVLLVFFASYWIIKSNTNLGQGTSCEGVGGKCQPDCAGLDGYVRSPTNSCASPDDVCCLPLLKSNSNG